MNTKEQFVITIAREIGSGGRTVGRKLAEKLGVTVDITFTPEQEYLANARINSHYRQDTPWAQVLSFVPKAPIPTDLNAVA